MMMSKQSVRARAGQLSRRLAALLGAMSMAAAPTFAAGDSYPGALKGCVLWLKADAGVTVDENGRVSGWQDQSGQGHHLAKVSGSAPVLVTGLNGRPVVRFDGQGSLEGTYDFSKALSAHSLLLLARWTDTDAAHCQRILFSPTWNWGFGFSDGDDQSWFGGAWIYQKDWNVYGPGSTNTHWHLHTATMGDGPKQWVEFWKDGTEVMQRRLNLPAGDVVPRQIALGGKSKCEIAEVLLYDRPLSREELTGLWKYLSAKYHITTPAVSVPGSPPEQLQEATHPIARGPFKPDWRSFKQYECPQWFRDAKFGIWAHWGPQCQPEQGDWYAFHMYRPEDAQYKYHVEHYGHPSTFGFKDVCNEWKADKWEPEKLIRLYKRAGARYFVAMANHHDNFDNWNSKYQPWNSVNVGPKKDIIGTWAKAARAVGLRFGVTVHTARAWGFYEPAHGSDKTGPMAGVPYDGALTKADGKGTWWDGLDPADLYGPHGAARTPEALQAYKDKFFYRVKDLVDSYRPDLLYFDDTVPPLGAAGMDVVAHFLNANREWHHGRMEAVYNTKIYDAEPPRDVYKCLVDDFEGGRADSIQTYPWQTDTCIGNWHYLRGIQYRSVESVVRELVDIVSKNGNLLLNIPVRGNGTIDEEEMKFLAGLTRWMDVNSESIYGTRPWRVYGEGETDSAGKFVNNGRDRPFSGSDIRFVRKGSVLYATFLAWPGRQAVVRSLARSATNGKVTGVSLLGHRGNLAWKQTDDGLEVTMPEEKPCEHAFVLKIAGAGDAPAAAAPAPDLRNPVWATADNLRDPSVLKTPAGYWLFYSRLAGGNWGSADAWSVAAAFTRDFSRFDNDHDVSPRGCASPGDVVSWHGRYLLPYQTYPAHPCRLCYSESTDLRAWSEPKRFLDEALALPWNKMGRVIDPSFVVDGDVLHCFFVGSATHKDAAGRNVRANLLGHAITRDPKLEKWEILTKEEPMIGVSERAPDGVENVAVFKTGDHWTMVYSEGLANQHLALATSPDLRQWKLEGPIEIPRQQWMARKYGAPFIWRDGDEWRMILMGEDGRGRTTFGLLSSPDGRQWTPLPER